MFCEEAPPVGSIAGKKGTVNHKLFSGSFRSKHAHVLFDQLGIVDTY